MIKENQIMKKTSQSRPKALGHTRSPQDPCQLNELIRPRDLSCFPAGLSTLYQIISRRIIRRVRICGNTINIDLTFQSSREVPKQTCSGWRKADPYQLCPLTRAGTQDSRRQAQGRHFSSKPHGTHGRNDQKTKQKTWTRADAQSK